MRELYPQGWWRTKFSFKEAWRADAVTTRFHQAGFVGIEATAVEYSRPVGVIGAMHRAGAPVERMTRKLSRKLFKSEYGAYPTQRDLFGVDAGPG